MPCAGNPDQTCGGPNRLSLYASAPIPSGSATVTPPVTVNPPASTTSSAVPLPTVSGWSYGGCYVDMAYGRTLRFQQPDSQTLTPESCIATCSGLGYTVAALQYSAQCFCDNYLVFGATAAPEADCNMPCSGDATKKCGAGNRNSVYYIGTLQILPVPAAQETGLPGSWEYQGCITDPGLFPGIHNSRQE